MYFVRSANAADAKKIARVQIERWRINDRGQTPGTVLKAPSVKRREAFWSGRLEQASGSVFVIASDVIVGFCDLIPSRDKGADPKTVGEIAAVYVVSDDLRLGAGKALCHHALTVARKRGYKALTLWVLASNGNAMRFYEALGFGRDGAVKIATASDGNNLHEIRYRISFEK
jgi:ribosomal protein S18 acetylase RimI-like enzyme